MTHRKRRFLRVIVVAIFVTVVGLLWRELACVRTDDATTRWRRSGPERTVVVTVRSGNGTPLAAQRVDAWSDSGRVPGVTNLQGQTQIELGEGEIVALDVNERRVVDRSGALMGGIRLFPRGLAMEVELNP